MSDVPPPEVDPAEEAAIERLLLRIARRRLGAHFIDPDEEEIAGALALSPLARANFALHRMVMFDHAVLPRDAEGDVFYFDHQTGPEETTPAFPFYPAEIYGRLDLADETEEIRYDVLDMDRLETRLLPRMARDGIHVRLCPRRDENAILIPAQEVLSTLKAMRFSAD